MSDQQHLILIGLKLSDFQLSFALCPSRAFVLCSHSHSVSVERKGAESFQDTRNRPHAFFRAQGIFTVTTQNS